MKLKHSIYFISILLLGCKPTVTDRDNSDSDISSNKTASEKTNYIANASFSIKKNNSGYTVQLVKLQKQPGRLKTPHTSKKTFSKKHILCSVLDNNNTILESIALPDPLLREVEYVDDTNQFVKQTIALDSATFSARFSFTKASKFVRIQYILENLDTLQLKKIKL